MNDNLKINVNKGEYIMLKNVQRLIRLYEETAYLYGEMMERGDYEMANLNLEKNELAFDQLIKCGDIGCNALLDLLDHRSPHVRISAATHLLNTYYDRAVNVLKKLSDNSGFQGLTAKMVLEDFKNGDIVIPRLKINKEEH